MRLPSQFVNRLGELAGAKLEMDTVESLNKGTKWFSDSKQYSWGIGEGTIPEHMIPVMNQQVQLGIQIKMLIPNELFVPVPSGTPKNGWMTVYPKFLP